MEESFEGEVKKILDVASGDIFSKLERLQFGLEGLARCIKEKRSTLKLKLTRQLERLIEEGRDDKNLSNLIDTKIQMN